MTLSARTKLAVWYFVTVTALLAVFVGADMVGLRQNLLGRIDDQLDAAAQSFTRDRATHPARLDAAVETLGNQLVARGGVVVRIDDGGVHAIYPTGVGAELVDSLGSIGTTGKATIDDTYRVMQLDVAGADGTRLVLGLPVGDELDTWRRAIWEHVILAGILIAVVSLLGYGVILWALRPVRKLTEMVHRITASDLSRRVDGAGDRFEIGQLASTFNEVIARLQIAFERETRFSADVAHELKTPLAVLRGELELALSKDRSAEEYRAMIAHLASEAVQLGAIVDDLLFLARPESPEGARALRPISLDDAVLAVFERLTPAAQAANIELELVAIAPVRVNGDRPLLERLVENLLTNAIKFTPGGRRVEVELAAGGASTFTLVVRDQGIGIAEDERERIFQRFYRADRSRSRRTGGVGLGLAIVAEIVRLHGFAVTVDGTDGTTFTISGATCSP